MTTLLCAAPHCRKPGSHTTTCKNEPDKPCPGCLPAVAADGLYLCVRCTNRLVVDTATAATLWAELGLALIGQGGPGARGTNPQPGLALNGPAVEHRTLIRHTLVSWALLIAEERGIELPWRWTPWHTIPLPTGVLGPLNRQRWRTVDHRTDAIAALVARHSGWLAAQRYAGEAAGELRHLVDEGWKLRQPSSTRVVQIGPCPQQVADDDGEQRACGGTLRALLRAEASLLPSAVACDAEETHSWDSTQWSKLGRTMKARVAA